MPTPLPNICLRSNLLLTPPPEELEISGEAYKINSDFRVVLRFCELQRDPRIYDRHKGYMSLKMFFQVMPHDTKAAFERIGWFIACGRDVQGQRKSRRNDFDFGFDAGLIYASFMADYGLDLSTVRLHWWRFSALLAGLSEGSILRQVINLRNRSEDGLNPAARDALREAKKAWALPVFQDKRSADLTAALKSGDGSKIARLLK